MKIIHVLLVFLGLSGFIEIANSEPILVVRYTHSIHIELMPSATVVNSVLITNNENSLYEMDFLNNPNFIDEQDTADGNVVLSVKPTNNPKIYKNLKRNYVYSHQRIFSTKYTVSDSLVFSNWVLKDEYKNILGYKCQKATVHYRGRDYFAYFTTEINFNDGPWKFYGLPGVILNVESVDGVLKIMANQISVKNQAIQIKNPFLELMDESITWEKFIEKYKKKYNELLSFKDEDGVTASIPKKNIEVYIED